MGTSPGSISKVELMAGLVPRQTQAWRVWLLVGSGVEPDTGIFMLLVLKSLCARQLLSHMSFPSLL